MEDDDILKMARNRKRKRVNDTEEEDADGVDQAPFQELQFRTPPPKRSKVEAFDSLGKIGFAKNTREENRRVSREFKSVDVEEQLLNAELEELYSPQPKPPPPKRALPPTAPALDSRDTLQPQSATAEFQDTSETGFLAENIMPTLLGRVLRGETVMTPDALLDYFGRVRYAAGSGHAS
eukprot:TRINITY_DN15762_c0_g1_i1.p1 TRINITY_DN15762_c0_g1~~TRINITY_DN15762_c0_g1_i1.p1  ORF type:complete len:179 (-),score=31.44 TRINITY_DN15762_c0_g1_i1:335-871(-)